VTVQHSTDLAMQTVNDALGRFLAAPPAGTPAEVVELLTLMAGDPGAPLPPRIYFEAVEQSPLAISITDSRARILYANRAFEALTGYSRAEVLGRNESILSSKATPEPIYRKLWRTIKGKQVWSGTLVNRTRDGVEYVAALTIAPVLDRKGETAYFLGMHRDITGEHELKTHLRQQKMRVEAVLDAAPVLVVLLDGSGRVLLSNHEYKRLHRELGGHEPAEVLCRALSEQAGLDPLEAGRARRSFKDVEVSMEIPGSGGPRWFSCSGKPASEADPSALNYFARRGGGERRLLLLANDITARRREVERAHLEHLRARLAEQQMIYGMREALGAAIYQLQGPLNVIRAALGMLQGGQAEPVALAGMLANIDAMGQQALATLQAALPSQALEAGAPVNVNALLRQVLELETERLLAEGIVVDWQPALVLPSIAGRKNQLRSLFKHLIDNAILALSETASTHREIRLATRALGEVVEVEVQDNGPGIRPEDRFKVFEPLFIGWRNRRGRAGMGLALAQQIVNEHGGGIAIDPEYHDGCRIRLTLSAVAADQ
jgi:nitrogen fixation negative regulator NifL